MILKKKNGNWFVLRVILIGITLNFFSLVFGQNSNRKSLPRTVFNINSDWHFIKNEIKSLDKINLNSNDWQPIKLPHNWGFQEAQKGNKEYYKGVGWYKKLLDINFKKNKRYFLRFGAASKVANVYINNKHVGAHRGSFGAFGFEITKYLSDTEPNIVVVSVDNSKFTDIAPLGGDFNVYGGLYRSVFLIETAKVSFALTDHVSKGVTWLQSEVSDEKALLEVIGWISNGTSNGLPFTHFPKEIGETIQEGRYLYRVKLLDHQDKEVAAKEIYINISPNLTAPYTLTLELQNPHLWHGTKDPYLYKAVAEVREPNGELVDRVTQNIGLRSFYIDAEKGFFLNDKPYRLRGVSKHQDRKDIGWAVSKEHLEEDIDLIKEMGANALRCAHYQHSDDLVDLCDKAGILVWSEIPLVGSMNEDKAFAETTKNQLKDMIRQQINHPSVFAWGLFNEIHVKKNDPHRMLMDLKLLANAEDKTRPTIAATSHMAAPEINKIPNILGWNRYPGWYDPFEHLKNAKQWNKYKNTSKDGGFCFSEHGAGANIKHHEQNPEQPVPKSFWHPEEWQAKVHEAAWESYSSTPYIWGSFVWNMFDFASVKREEGGVIALNDKGLVTFNRKTKKDAFYFYKANWSNTPMVHITSKRHDIRNEVETPIKIYTNLSKVTCYVNDSLIGEIEPNAYHIAIFKDVELVKGENKIIAIASGENQELKDEVIWVYDPNHNSIKPKEDKQVKRIHGDGGFGQ
ncbi:glycoside hydrolase family 2 TIM barrel-domain containing protein [Flavivirga amylovorans]|uniref:Glycoside hydrolase family 2 TIM barrel-domain containing protein n=1 Tax=Flavivirga amylovorans TaxID=870486 RepID=A0ABT8WW21_9FLAO|nr:glycoside hydrolase family 2 TIM barrel-domain containing protein [Flavivirga amylovorans]MDO5985858.1 glycoside hydrolase family 2 TIM barrel-domain containing protein [Flavivirga amylovorans]